MLIHIPPQRALVSLLLCAGLFAGCSKASLPPATVQKDAAYYDRQAFILPLNANFILYDSLMQVTGLTDTLAQAGPFTTVIPDNNAIETIGWGYVYSSGQIDYLEVPANARSLFLSLIFRGAFHLDSLPVAANQVWTSLGGAQAYVSKYIFQGDTLYTFNGVPVSSPDFPASNGPIQVLDAGVPNIQAYQTITAYVNSAPELTYLAVALQRSGLGTLLSDTGSWTLLAPTNAAFTGSADPSLNSLEGLLAADTAKLAALIRFHLLPGRRFIFDFNLLANAFNNSSTGTTDSVRIPTANGVSIDYINQSGTPYFCGSGDSALNYNYNTGTYVSGPNPIGLYSPSYGSFIYDRPVGNGAVQELGGLLLP
jgi:uncharacterized surface protein with fasciclin (FAS1) repeats